MKNNDILNNSILAILSMPFGSLLLKTFKVFDFPIFLT